MSDFISKLRAVRKNSWLVLILLGMLAFPQYLFAGSIEDLFRTVTFANLRETWEKEKGFKILPYLKTRFDWTSNVFKASDQVFQADPNGSGGVTLQHSDSIYSLIPGFNFDYQGDYLRFGGAYEAAFRYFNRFSSQNTQDQHFTTYAHFRPTDRTYLKLHEELKQAGATAGSPVFEPTNYRDNTADAVFGFKNDASQTFEVSYQNYDHEFQENIAKRYSYNENKYGSRVYHPVTGNIEIFSGIDLGTVTFEDNSSRDTFYWEIPAGLRGKFFWGWEGLLSAGVHHRNLEASERNDLTSVTTQIALRRSFDFLGARDRIVDPTSFEWGFIRRPVESTFSTATTYDDKTLYTSIKHLFTEKARGRVSMYLGNQSYDERVFTGSRVVVGGTVFATSPDQIRRNDRVLGLTLGWDYDFCKRLKLHFDYNYSRRESNVNGLDYTDHTVSVHTTMPL